LALSTASPPILRVIESDLLSIRYFTLPQQFRLYHSTASDRLAGPVRLFDYKTTLHLEHTTRRAAVLNGLDIGSLTAQLSFLSLSPTVVTQRAPTSLTLTRHLGAQLDLGYSSSRSTRNIYRHLPLLSSAKAATRPRFVVRWKYPRWSLARTVLPILICEICKQRLALINPLLVRRLLRSRL
jgi:hypothetical protein